MQRDRSRTFVQYADRCRTLRRHSFVPVFRMQWGRKCKRARSGLHRNGKDHHTTSANHLLEFSSLAVSVFNLVCLSLSLYLCISPFLSLFVYLCGWFSLSLSLCLSLSFSLFLFPPLSRTPSLRRLLALCFCPFMSADGPLIRPFLC